MVEFVPAVFIVEKLELKLKLIQDDIGLS